jgi:hypothetical protein
MWDQELIIVGKCHCLVLLARLDHKGHKDHRVYRDRKVHQEFLAHKDHKDHRDRKDRKVIKDRKGHRVYRDHKDQLGLIQVLTQLTIQHLVFFTQ